MVSPDSPLPGRATSYPSRHAGRQTSKRLMGDEPFCCRGFYRLRTQRKLAARPENSIASSLLSTYSSAELIVGLVQRPPPLPGPFWRLGELSCHLCARFRGTFCRRNARVLAHRPSRDEHRTLFLLWICPPGPKKASAYLMFAPPLIRLARI